MSKEVIYPFFEGVGPRMSSVTLGWSSTRGLVEQTLDYCSQFEDYPEWVVFNFDGGWTVEKETLGEVTPEMVEAARAACLSLVAEEAAAEAANAAAHAAVAAMQQADPEYWGKVIQSRLVDGNGSRTEFVTAADLQAAIEAATFVPYEHEALTDGCIAFKCDIPGLLGVAPIVSSSMYVLQDPKNTGKVSASLALTTGATRKHPVDFSVLICGEDEGELRAFTFHPGAPVKASQVDAEGRIGLTLSGDEALALGLTHAKV